MATWIESHKELERHPKVLELSDYMGWDLDQTIGKLHRLWWWCVDYAEDGDLRKHNDCRIAQAMGVAIADAPRLVEALVKACWLEREPYFRVHDWWDYAGNFLRVRYKHNPEKWQEIRSKCVNGSKNGSKNRTPHITSPHITSPEEGKRVREVFQKPTPEQVGAYGAEIGFPLDGRAFCDSYEAKGWLIGKNPMKDWKAAVRTWKNNGYPCKMARVLPPRPTINDVPAPEPTFEVKCPKCGKPWQKMVSDGPSDVCGTCEHGKIGATLKTIPPAPSSQSAKVKALHPTQAVAG